MASCVIRTGRVTLERSRHTFGSVRPGALVLDVGAGNSPLVAQLRAAGFSAVALDPDYARRPTGDSAGVAGAVPCLPFRAFSFDEVHCSYVLMHLSDRSAAVGELLRVARWGGRVCITPIWPKRVTSCMWAKCPEARLIPGSRYPRRRASLELSSTGQSHSAELVELVARVSGPPELIRRFGSMAMSVVVKKVGTPEIDVGRFWLRRASTRDA
jgi:SAM-dependent methyltransferase